MEYGYSSDSLMQSPFLRMVIVVLEKICFFQSFLTNSSDGLMTNQKKRKGQLIDMQADRDTPINKLSLAVHSVLSFIIQMFDHTINCDLIRILMHAYFDLNKVLSIWSKRETYLGRLLLEFDMKNGWDVVSPFS